MVICIEHLFRLCPSAVSGVNCCMFPIQLLGTKSGMHRHDTMIYFISSSPKLLGGLRGRNKSICFV